MTKSRAKEIDPRGKGASGGSVGAWKIRCLGDDEWATCSRRRCSQGIIVESLKTHCMRFLAGGR